MQIVKLLLQNLREGSIKKGVIIVFPVFPSPAYKESGEVVIWFILSIVF